MCSEKLFGTLKRELRHSELVNVVRFLCLYLCLEDYPFLKHHMSSMESPLFIPVEV